MSYNAVAIHNNTTTRTTLSKDTFVYVRSTGNDSHTGLSEEQAVATMARAFAIVRSFDPAGRVVIIDIGPGEFITPNITFPEYDRNTLYIQGAGVDQTMLVGSSGTGVNLFTSMSIGAFSVEQRLLLQGTSYVRQDIYGNTRPSDLRIVGSGGDYDQGFQAQLSSTLYLTGTIKFTGTFRTFYYVQDATIFFHGTAISDFTDAPTATDSGFHAIRDGAIHLYTSTFAGSFTGRKYWYTQGGMISGQSKNENLDAVIPGSIEATRPGNPCAFLAAKGVAWAVAGINATGAIDTGAINISTCTKTAIGVYKIGFTCPIENTSYRILCAPYNIPSTTGGSLRISQRTTNGFTVAVLDSTGTSIDGHFHFICV